MGSSAITVMLAAMSATAAQATRSSPAGSNIGPALPIVLGLAVIGVAIYLIRQRGRRPPGGQDR